MPAGYPCPITPGENGTDATFTGLPGAADSSTVPADFAGFEVHA